MPLPGNFSTVPVHGKYLDLAGAALAGTVTFTATPDALTDPAALIIIMSKPLVMTLDVNGEFTTNLPATDDPDIDPIGFTYKVVEAFPGRDVAGREYYITVPVASLPGGIDLTTAAPAIPVDGVARGQFLNDLGDVDTTGAVTDSPLVLDSSGEWVAGPALSATFQPLAGQFSLPYLYKKVAALRAGTASRIRYSAVGDSYGEKLLAQHYDLLKLGFGGVAGVALDGTGDTITTNATSGTVTAATGVFTRWVTGKVTTLGSAGASITYGVGGGSFLCDTISVLLLNDGGACKIQVDGVDNTTPTLTSDGSLHVVTMSVAHGAHTVTIVQTSGSPTHVSYGVVFEDSTRSGFMPIHIQQEGIALSTATAQAWTNLATFRTAFPPDVSTLEVKDPSAGLASSLDSLAGTFSGLKTDVIWIQSPPMQPSDDPDNVVANALIKAKAAQYGFRTWDSYEPFAALAPHLGATPYDVLVTLAWQGDGVHIDTVADKFRSRLFLRDFGIVPFLIDATPFPVATTTARLNTSLKVGPFDPPALDIEAEQTFGTDSSIKVQGALTLYASDGTTVLLRVGGSGQNVIPSNAQFGPGGPQAQAVGGGALFFKNAADTDKADIYGKFGNFAYLGVGNAAAATTPGSVVKKTQVYDADGASLGYIAIYSSIT